MSEVRFRDLHAAAGSPQPVASLLDAIVADPAPRVAGRPRTIGVMVSSADGRATVEGGASGLGGPEDRAVFRGVRERADALLVGPSTLNRERYATVLDEDQRERRRAAGRPPEPLLATISRSFGLDADVPILHEPEARVVVYGEREPPPALAAAPVEVVQLERADPAAALADLDRRGIELLACEGGPTLLAGLIRDGLLDEVLLTVSPLLVGGLDPLTILDGPIGPRSGSAGPTAPSDPVPPVAPVTLQVRGLWQAADVLFLHYHLTDGSPQ
ncbi:dihydrofolate reductase family protein [Patulibacter defluvii]|uniref:dihydrofolate reductase family protein n=1 Tax=Patulibacter defluvii TaxID=3095358 RepID=UPI002A7552BB|nr:dihydrofolate reductase family protein [Patulibacter sp. DM4]